MAPTGTAGAAPGPRGRRAGRVRVPTSPRSRCRRRRRCPTHDAARRRSAGRRLAATGLAVPAGAPAPPGTQRDLVAGRRPGHRRGARRLRRRTRYGAPASVQKLLLAATVLPKLDPADVDHDHPGGPRLRAGQLGGRPGARRQYTVETLWLGLLLNSGNDARQRAGPARRRRPGRAGHARRHERRGPRLGALETHAETPSGLDGPGQVTSAYDLALIARACFARPDFRRYAATRTAQIPPQPPQRPEGLPDPERQPAALQLPRRAGRQDRLHRPRPAHLRRRGRAQRPPAGGHPARRRDPAAARLAAGRRACSTGASACRRGASVGHLVDPGEADKLMAPPSPRRAGAGRSRRCRRRRATRTGAGRGRRGRGRFAGVWLFAVLLGRRRRAAYRQWRCRAAAWRWSWPAAVDAVRRPGRAGPRCEPVRTDAVPAPAPAAAPEHT